MDKAEHGARLKSAISRSGLDRQAVADAVGTTTRSITNWQTGATMPPEKDRDALRRLLGDYDAPGDAVESAIRSTDLAPWRKTALIAEYQRHRHEQDVEATG